MGLLKSISNLFTTKPPVSKPTPGSSQLRAGAPRPAEPVDIDISDNESPGARRDDDDLLRLDDDEPAPTREHEGRRALVHAAPAIPVPKSKNEIIADLQKNYAEVMELIRKVSNHLDRESERSERLMEIAEKIPAALETLPELRAQNEEIIVALRQAAAETAKRDEAAARTLELLGDRMDEARESDRQLVGTMAEFRGTLREMADSSEKTGATLSVMNERNIAREQELQNILLLTKRWITIATVVGVVLVMIATAAVIMVAARG